MVMPDSGVAATGYRMLNYALCDDPVMVYALAAALDDEQLLRLAKAASLVKQAAQDEFGSRREA